MMAASTSRVSTGWSVTAAARSGRLQISSREMLCPDIAVRLHIPAGLPHEPHGPHVGGTAPAGIKESAGHGRRAHSSIHLV